MASTTINPDYNPGDEWIIPVVVHVISNSSGTGDISDEMVASQIRVLNEDYLALPGTPGENGTYTGIRFVLALDTAQWVLSWESAQSLPALPKPVKSQGDGVSARWCLPGPFSDLQETRAEIKLLRKE